MWKLREIDLVELEFRMVCSKEGTYSFLPRKFVHIPLYHLASLPYNRVHRFEPSCLGTNFESHT